MHTRALSRVEWLRSFSILDGLVKRWVVLLFGLVLVVAAARQYLAFSSYDGGWELWSTYLPKTLMLLRGQDPYSTQISAAPYPPFLFLVLAGIVRLTTLGSIPGPAQADLAGLGIRMAGLVANLLVGVMIFFALRVRKVSGVRLLFPPALFLLLPSIALANTYWFHADIFGYLILGAGLLAFVKEHVMVGTSLLALGVIFKIHPILSLLLVAVWLIRKNGFLTALPSVAVSMGVLSGGMVLPVLMPGYVDAVVGFNLSYGSVGGMTSFTLMNLFNGLLPTAFGVTVASLQVNQIWAAATAALFTISLGVVWTHAGKLEAADVVLLGFLVWFIPLRTLYPYYLVWAFIPLLFRGNTLQLIVLGGVFEAANIMTLWSWNVPPNPFPMMNSVLGFFITSLAFTAWSSLGLGFLLRELRDRRTPYISTYLRVLA